MTPGMDREVSSSKGELNFGTVFSLRRSDVVLERRSKLKLFQVLNLLPGQKFQIYPLKFFEKSVQFCGATEKIGDNIICAFYTLNVCSELRNELELATPT